MKQIIVYKTPARIADGTQMNSRRLSVTQVAAHMVTLIPHTALRG